MAIKVRVVNADPDHPLDPQPPTPDDSDEVAKILTPEYVAEVNRGITYRILERERAFRFDPSTGGQIVG